MNIPKELTRAFQDTLAAAAAFEKGHINKISYDILCEDFLEQLIDFLRSPDSESALKPNAATNLEAAW